MKLLRHMLKQETHDFMGRLVFYQMVIIQHESDRLSAGGQIVHKSGQDGIIVIVDVGG